MPSYSSTVIKMNVRIALAFIAWCILFYLLMSAAHARWNEKYAQSTPEMREWFQSLKSGRGPCCADADGSTLKDNDWEATKDGHYRVRIDGEWVDVPDDAVITEPNRAGRTIVWPMYLNGRLVIRCFMPGAMI